MSSSNGLKVNENGTYPIRFNARWGRFFPGEVAAFDEELAAKLCKATFTTDSGIMFVAEPFECAKVVA